MQKILLFLTLMFLGCGPNVLTTKIIETDLIPVNVTDKSKDNEMSHWISSYKATLDKVMGVPIGYASVTMKAAVPESLLGSLITTAMEDYAYRKSMLYDCVITNIGGIRDSITQGEINIGHIYNVSPFDNRMVILTISGQNMKILCQIIAQQGGQITSGISMKIYKNKAQNIKINKLPIDTMRNYKILTNDYLSFGNDYLYPLANYTEIYTFELTLRDIIINYIQQQTQNNKPITAALKNEVILVDM